MSMSLTQIDREKCVHSQLGASHPMNQLQGPTYAGRAAKNAPISKDLAVQCTAFSKKEGNLQGRLSARLPEEDREGIWAKIADYSRIFFLGIAWTLFVYFSQIFGSLKEASISSLAGLVVTLHMIIQGI